MARRSILTCFLLSLIFAGCVTAQRNLFRGWLEGQTRLRRIAPAEYDDLISSPRSKFNNKTLPGARLVSNLIAKQSVSEPESTGLNSLFWTWGQFVDHDMVMVPENEEEKFDIPVPPDNSRFSDLVSQLRFHRSLSTTGRRRREQLNRLTPSIDASQVYGSTEIQAKNLRTEGGRGYLLETSEGDYMKWDPMANNFVAGDARVSEQPALTAMHAVFLREHNRLAGILATQLMSSSNESIYQTARLLVGAEIQIVTRNEFLPHLIGSKETDFGFRRNAKPEILNEFATACFRFGHTMVPSNLLVGNRRFCSIESRKISLRESFFNPSIFKERGIDSILRGTVIQPAESLDNRLVSDLRDFLFESQPGRAFGVDLASFNIQRGRDHGLPNYCALQRALGFQSRGLRYSDVTSDRNLAGSLRRAYGNDPCAMDMWVAALAEDKSKNSLLGKTCKKIISRQFVDTFRSDRFYVSNVNWTAYGLSSNPTLGNGVQLEDVTLSDVIRWNTNVGADFPSNAFMVKTQPRRTC